MKTEIKNQVVVGCMAMCEQLRDEVWARECSIRIYLSDGNAATFTKDFDKYGWKIYTEPRFVFGTWKNVIVPRIDGWVRIECGDKYNLVNAKKKFLLEEWADFAGVHFEDGWMRLKRKGKYNFVDKNGRFLLDEWADDADYFIRSCVRIRLNGKWNFACVKGGLLLKEWVDDAESFGRRAWTLIMKGNKWNIVNATGRLKFRNWADEIVWDRAGNALARRGRRWHVAVCNQEDGLN